MTELDSNGNPPKFKPGERVCVHPLKMEATVIEQLLSYDYPECFWGNVNLRCDDGLTGTSNSWQLTKIENDGS